MLNKYILGFGLVGILAFHCFGQQPKTSKPDSIRVIKLTDIQDEYGKVLTEVPSITQQYADSSQLKKAEKSFEKYSTIFSNNKKETDRLLQHYVSSWQIKNLNAKLNRSNENFENLSKEVNTTAAVIESSFLKIESLLTDWRALEKRIENDSISMGLMPQVQEILSRLKEAEKLLQGQFTNLLAIQNQVKQLQVENSQYLKKVEIAEYESIVKLFNRDVNFIWNRVELNQSEENIQTLVEALKLGTKDSLVYLSEKWKAIVLLFFLGIGLYAVFQVFKKKQLNAEETSPLLVNNPIGKFPIASALITVLLFSFFVLTNRPALLTEILLIGFIIPFLLFSAGKSVTNPWVYWLIFFTYVLDVLILHIPLENIIQNIVLLIINILTFLLLYWMYKNPEKYLKSTITPVTEQIKTKLIPFFVYLSALSLLVAIIGYLELSKLLITGVITSLYLGPVILICSLIIRNLIETLSSTLVFENSFLAKKYFPIVIKLVSIGAFMLWVSAFLKAFGVFPFILQFLNALWDFGGTFGNFSISVGDVASVILTIVISFILSEFIQVLLEKEVFSRFNVARGVPMAIGVLGKYFIITIGFFLAIATTGFDLTKISIIAGALGVGIGFGLQNLVSNFVSGMILIFERPILVGDIIEAEGIEGQVTQIGVRASKMLTYAGAEVVIPNSNLINNRISNWTLSNRRRRFTIEVRTNKGADPSEIVSAITSIALEHTHIIKDPKPFVIFEGQVDQSLLFKVYYWQVGELLSTRSDLNLQIYTTLKARGIELSIPIYEIKNVAN